MAGREGGAIMSCTACALDRPEMLKRCRERFTCETCGQEHNCCAALPGWPHQTRNECIYCLDSRALPLGWDAQLWRAVTGRTKPRRLAQAEDVKWGGNEGAGDDV